jgi:hypothetical protein
MCHCWPSHRSPSSLPVHQPLAASCPPRYTSLLLHPYPGQVLCTALVLRRERQCEQRGGRGEAGDGDVGGYCLGETCVLLLLFMLFGCCVRPYCSPREACTQRWGQASFFPNPSFCFFFCLLVGCPNSRWPVSLFFYQFFIIVLCIFCACLHIWLRLRVYGITTLVHVSW